MELLAFFGWLWSWGWKIALCTLVAFVLFVVISESRLEKRYRFHIPHPIDWLSVMNTERWDSSTKLKQLMNSKLNVKLFRMYESKDYKVLPWYRFLSPHTPIAFYNDLVWLEQQGLVECRRMVYDKSGRECPDVDFAIRDEQGETIGFDKEMMGNYSLPTYEYKKTSSGGGIKRNTAHARQEDKGFSGDLEGSRA